MYYYSVESDKKLITVKAEGQILLEDIFGMIDHVYKKTVEFKDLFFILDNSKAELKFSETSSAIDIFEIKNRVVQRLEGYNSIKHAVITVNESDKGFDLFFKSIIAGIPNYEFEAFGTIEEARIWMKLD